MKNSIKNTRAKLQNLALTGVFAVTAFVGSAANAAGIDTTAVQTAIASAETDALTTGQYVIGTVASLVVITLVIGIVKKI